MLPFAVPGVVPERGSEAKACGAHEGPLSRHHGKPQRLLHAGLGLGAGKNDGYQGQRMPTLLHPSPPRFANALSQRTPVLLLGAVVTHPEIIGVSAAIGAFWKRYIPRRPVAAL